MENKLNENQYNYANQLMKELMELLNRKECKYCNCYVVNLKRHYKSRVHYRNIMNILN